MYHKFYLNYFVLNFIISLLFLVIAMYPQNLLFNYWIIGGAWIFGIIFMHVIIIRLPIFKQYYINRKKLNNYIIQQKPINHAEDKAAPMMCSLISGIIFGVLLIGLGVSNYIIEYAFIAGISTGCISYYYAP